MPKTLVYFDSPDPTGATLTQPHAVPLREYLVARGYPASTINELSDAEMTLNWAHFNLIELEQELFDKSGSALTLERGHWPDAEFLSAYCEIRFVKGAHIRRLVLSIESLVCLLLTSAIALGDRLTEATKALHSASEGKLWSTVVRPGATDDQRVKVQLVRCYDEFVLSASRGEPIGERLRKLNDWRSHRIHQKHLCVYADWYPGGLILLFSTARNLAGLDTAEVIFDMKELTDAVSSLEDLIAWWRDRSLEFLNQDPTSNLS